MTTMDDRRRAGLYDLARREGIDPETLYAAWQDGDGEAQRLRERASAPDMAVVANALVDDDDTLRALAAGVYPPTEREARAMATEVLRLRSQLRDAARAHLAADDALSLARRTDAADVPTAEARALAGLVGYAGEVPP